MITANDRVSKKHGFIYNNQFRVFFLDLYPHGLKKSSCLLYLIISNPIKWNSNSTKLPVIRESVNRKNVVFSNTKKTKKNYFSQKQNTV